MPLIPLNKAQTVAVYVDNMAQAGPPGPTGPVGPPGSSTINLIAGAGLIGGGLLSEDRTVSIVGGNGIKVNADSIEIDPIVIPDVDYIDQEVTVSSIDPIGIPPRNGLLWITYP